METPYTIEYEFNFSDGDVRRFGIKIDPATISIMPSDQSRPDWTRLEVQQCSCCSLSPDEVQYCPIAVNIAELVETCKSMSSTDVCDVKCVTAERTYLKRTSVQEGLFSIFGVIMATSDCPEMQLFKPMARFHLPFSTVEETVLRFSAIYFLRQYFEYHAGRTPDLNLTKMDEHYEKVQLVNAGILGRIRQIASEDADANAIIILNSLAQMVTLEAGDSFSSLKYLFEPRRPNS